MTNLNDDMRQLREASLAASLDAVVTIDESGDLVDWNPAAEQTFGYLKHEALGKPMVELIVPPHLREAHLRGLERFLKTGQARIAGRRVEVQAMRRNREVFPCEISFHPILLSSGMYFTAYLRDLTERKAIERQLKELSTLQKKFVADAAHEIRTPLTAIQGNLDLLYRHPDLDPQELKEILEDARREAARLGRLVSDMLLLARGDSGQVFREEEVQLDQVLLEAFREVRRRNPQHHFVRGDLPSVELYGDRDRLKQLVLILLDNAVKYTPEGGTIEMLLERDDAHATFQVKDTGVGIGAEDLPRVFERFYRVDAARKRSEDPGGTGLGLPIARWIAEGHHGQLWLESALGEGTTAWVRLPLRTE